ncbi:hypothetical protein P691DRAFT_680261 [Macrolepiota fuliginosa MF-IS2]|uniref:Uncharacterized protein n=1 Tax=Macrolepiota fuliginosa MF-IS2 TaxID=1400762 RepID=A0A9P6BYX0_9AGAR|nr:hypothetical protein P691DRAFT_680261 [Macrolepiota fuliginosa MF-IS2]
MEMVLVPGVNTRKGWGNGNETRPDNVFISGKAAEWITKCEAKPEETPPKVDHFPIHTWIKMPTERVERKPEPNWRQVDWEEFNKELEGRIARREWTDWIRTERELEEYMENLMEAIQEAIEAKVPKKKPSPYVKRWWTKELSLKKKEARRMGRIAKKYAQQPGHPIHKEWSEAVKDYGKGMMTTKMEHWESWLENINTTDFWDAYKFMTVPESDGVKTRVPPLWRKEGNEEVEVIDKGRRANFCMRLSSYQKMGRQECERKKSHTQIQNSYSET